MESDASITSTANPRIKDLARLRAHRGKTTQDLILVDGPREIDRAISAEVELVEAFYCPTVLKHEAKAALERCRGRGAKCIEVAQHVLEKISYGDRRDGLVVTAARPRRRLADLRISTTFLIAVIEAVEKPGNLGAILRSADGAGVDAIIVADPVADVFSPNVIRASTGIVFTLPVFEAAAVDVLNLLRTEGVQLVAAAPDADTNYTDIDYRKPTAVILGSEAKGLSVIWRDSHVKPAKIPMMGKADSLNVGTTAALFFYEARRQRGAVS
jgi:TrmH family RNA methyltransferase